MFRRTSLAGLVRKWFAPARPQKPARPRKASLAVESLEERMVLSTLQVTSLADDGGAGELRQVIAGASSGDTIQFSGAAASGTLNLQSQITISKNLTIQGPGAASLTIQDASGITSRLFHVNPSDTVRISGLSLDNANSGTLDNNGTIINLSGGAIYNDGTLTLDSCTLANNVAQAAGGALENASDGTLTVTNCYFNKNLARAGNGGGIDNLGTLSISDSLLQGNGVAGTGNDGGGIYDGVGASLTVSNCTFFQNQANLDGGGLEVAASATVTACTFFQNTAGSPDGGGGIHITGGTLTLDSTLMFDNKGDDISGTVASTSAYNLVSDGTGLSGISNNDSNHNQVGTSASHIDPKLAPKLQNNGGSTSTFYLQLGSPALGTGDPNQIATTDQRGLPRTVNGKADIGAYQTQPYVATITITDAPSSSPEGAQIQLSNTVTHPNQSGPSAELWNSSLPASIGDPTTPKFIFNPHTYGTDTVSLSVQDSVGDISTVTQAITITDVAPTVTLKTGTMNGLAFSGSGSFTDPGQNTWTATVNYGDGTASQPLTLTGKSFSLSHTYSQAGSYTVSVDVNDGSKDGTATLTAATALQKVQITGAPTGSSPEGTAISLGSQVTDSDASPTLTYAWQVTSGGKTVASGSNSSLSFTPAAAGSYTVKVNVTDQNGVSVNAQTAVTVGNVAPTVSLGSLPMQGVNLTGSGSFTDPGSNSWTATVDYGDGTGSQPLTLNAAKTFSLSHTYAAGGVYTVTVDVNDGSADGKAQASVTATTSVTPSTNLPAVASQITHLDENYRNFIRSAYEKYLGRAADQAGLDAWADQMENHGLSDERLEAGFIGSDEYIGLHGGKGAGWVKGMYQDLLGRTPADAEVNGWVNALNNGVAPSAVAYGFAASAEREGQRVQANYKTYLGRFASDAEVSAWVNAFTNLGVTNESMEAGFIGSTEYYNNPLKGRGTNADWVASVYQDVLARTATAGEVSTWSADLA